jgi:hypothetical protein
MHGSDGMIDNESRKKAVAEAMLPVPTHKPGWLIEEGRDGRR